MTNSKQDLLSLKEENQKLNEHLKDFLKKYQGNKKYITKNKVQQLVKEHESMIKNINGRIDDIIAKDDDEDRPAKKRRIVKPVIQIKSYLQHFIDNPGLQHLAEDIFVNLNDQDVETCRDVNRSFQQFMDSCTTNSLFWLKKFIRRGISKKNQMAWTRAIQLTKETNLEKYILSYLKRCEKNIRVVDLPCYIDEDFLKRSAKMIRMFLQNLENPNVPDGYGKDTIHSCAKLGDLETIKHMALLKVETANAPDRNWKTPIYWAALNGHTEIVRILAYLAENPNTTTSDGETPIYMAASRGHTEIIKILAPLSENPNTPISNGKTPKNVAEEKGHLEIVQVLESFQ